MRFLVVMSAVAHAFACPGDFFDTRCKGMNIAESNPSLSLNVGNRTSCLVRLFSDNTFDLKPMKVTFGPDESAQYVLPKGAFSTRYTKICGSDVFELTETPVPNDENSIVFYETPEKSSVPDYFAAVTCKSGRPQNGYLEIFTDLCEEQLQELRMTYNIDITEEDIEACLDDAENL